MCTSFFGPATRAYALGGFQGINVDVGEAERLRKKFIEFLENFVARFIFKTSVDLSRESGNCKMATKPYP